MPYRNSLKQENTRLQVSVSSIYGDEMLRAVFRKVVVESSAFPSSISSRFTLRTFFTKKAISWGRSNKAALWSGIEPSVSTRSGSVSVRLNPSGLISAISFRMSSDPWLQAVWTGVDCKPWLCLQSTAAPCCKSSVALSIWWRCTAQCNGVEPCLSVIVTRLILSENVYNNRQSWF